MGGMSRSDPVQATVTRGRAPGDARPPSGDPPSGEAGKIGWPAVATGAVLLLLVAALGSFHGFDVRFGGPRDALVFSPSLT